jgi:hypothetical protein
MIATMVLGLDLSIRRDVKNLAILQDEDAELRIIRQRVREGDNSLKNLLLMHEGLLYIAD